ncbi:amidohydrolase [Desulfonispora thiosulfatigenes DSM 11270]|uniref:Peptidase M20 domain-containing protein 2 n=1 Tax=Desulfonispora thiosulfatigenes DSM 11270 TaxID=656914 RepID=A0A1W1UKC7_DESTI|nr:M20 family metallopeptidase [Desulfonispora thiosulfatigenes]SMB81578.1 amidohydrolase [Desulfonispora thiosulfatigenes DSM 11270]
MELKDKIISEVEKNKDELINLSDYIFDNPELSFEEFKAVKVLTDKLTAHGFKVEQGVKGIETAFKATFEGKEQGPTIGILAEYDALPEIGHACGHNLIGTISIGAAISISKYMKDLKGTLVVYGTPAEEGGGGKVIMIEKGCFTDLDCAMIIHPADKTMVDDISLANAELVITFHGKPAHAAAFPHEGINALEAVIQTFNNINGLRGHLKDDIRIHGIITKGGVVTNIVPELAECRFSVRALKRKDLDKIVEKIYKCSEAASLSTGAKLEFKQEELSYDEIMNNSILTKQLEKNYLLVGEKVYPRNIEEGLGSTDMGNVTQVLPGFQSYIGLGEGLATHTTGFADACGSEAGHRALITATKALALTAIDLFQNPELVEKAQEEYKALKEEI